MANFPSCAAMVPIFRALPPEGLERLGQAMHHRRYAKGELVMLRGQLISHLVVVARGQLKLVHTTSGGREQVVRILEPGDFIGELALFTEAYSEGDLVAVAETEACLVARQAVQAILHEHPTVALALVKALAERLATAEQQIADLSLRAVGERLAAELLRLVADRPGPEGSGGPGGPGGTRVTLPVPWAEMAARLGTTPESLSRRLKAMAEEGLIRQEGLRTVLIQDFEGLRRMAGA